jgi:hypothetical protein
MERGSPEPAAPAETVVSFLNPFQRGGLVMSTQRLFPVIARSAAMCLAAGLVWCIGPTVWAQENPQPRDPFSDDAPSAEKPGEVDPFAVPAGGDPFGLAAPKEQRPGAQKKPKQPAKNEPKREADPPQDRLFGEKVVLAALDQMTELKCIEWPLIDVIDMLQEHHQIHIILDHRALDDVGLSSDCPVTHSIANIPLRAALDLMLRDLDLTWTIKSGMLLITTPDQLDEFEMLVTRVYDVSDLLVTLPQYPYRGTGLPTTSLRNMWNPYGALQGTFVGDTGSTSGQGGGGFGGGMGGMGGGGFFAVDPDSDKGGASPSRLQTPRNPVQWQMGGMGGMGGFGGEPATPRPTDELVDVITSVIEPQSWSQMGGVGECSPFGRLLAISQTHRVHEQIEELLAMLRAEMRGAVTVMMDIRWLLLDSEDLGELVPDGRSKERAGGRLAVDREALEEMTREVPGFRGRLACLGGQQVHLASGDRRTVVTGAIPVVGSGIGYNPQIDVPNVGVVLEICPSIVPDTETIVLDVESTVTGWRDSELVLQIGGSYPPSQKVEQPSGEIVEEPGGTSTVSVDRVIMPTHQLAATMRVPLRQPVLVGGLTLSPNEDAARGNEVQERKQLYLVVETDLVRTTE